MARLEVQLEADIKGLITKLNSAQKELKDTGKVSLKTGKELDKLGVTATKGGKKIKANATPAVQEFSRVIQDAPFGIQGVANNIQQLTAQFGNLSKKTGGSKAALKAMVGALTGPAGVLLAVSAVTSILVSYGDEILALINNTDELSKATLEYTGEAKKEISTLKTLLKVARDESNSKEVRQRAVDKLNKDYGKYLGNITLETINTETLKSKVDELTTAYLNQARVKGVQSLLEEKFAKLAEKTNSVLETQTNSSKRAASEQIRTNRKKLKTQEDVLKTLEEEQEKGRDVSQAISVVKNEIENLKKITSLEGRDIIAEGILSDRIKEETSDIQNEIESLQKVLKKSLEDSFEGVNLFDTSSTKNEVGKITADMVGNFKAISSNLQSVGIVPIKIDEQGIQGELQKANELYQTGFSDLVNTTNLLTDSIGSSFNALAGQITNSLATGNAVVDAFIGSLVNSLTQLLAQLIATSIAEKTIAQTKISTEQGKSNANAVTIASSAAAALGPLGAVAFPGILAAQLAIVNSAFAGIRAFATGGFSGDNNLIRVNGDEAILTSRDQLELANFMRNNRLENIAASKVGRNDVGTTEIVGVLRGKDIHLLNKRTSRTMRNVYSS